MFFIVLYEIENISPYFKEEKMKKIGFFMLMIGLMTLSIIAQSTTGRLIGSVSGPDGLLPGATVTITDSQTGRVQTTVSNGSGSFKFERLSFGNYTVKITADGFKSYVANNVKIDANREYTISPKLEVGDVTAEVTVQAGADIVNASNAELSTTVSPKQILDLPINGRNPLSLLNLQAGVNRTSSSINGQRSTSVNFTRDGVNIQDNFIRTGGFVQDRPTVDDIGEFTVSTQNAGAESGNGGSTQVQLITPRGGSDFHGALFVYNRNSKFAANTFGNNAAGVEKPFLNRNQVGGKLSGPLPVFGFGEGTPKFFKDKGFFFVSYERFILRQTSPITNRVLRAPFRDGSFSYIGATDGLAHNVNLLTGAGLSGAIPAASGGALAGVDPTIQVRFLGLTPTSGNSNSQNVLSNGQNVTQNLLFNQSNNTTRDQLTTRIDVEIDDKNSIYGVYKYTDDRNQRPDVDAGFGQNPFVNAASSPFSLVFNYTTILGSAFTNSTTVGYVYSNPFFNEDTNFPTDYRIGGLPLGLTTPEGSFQDQGRTVRQYVIRNDSTYSTGNHSFRFGIESNFLRIASVTNFTRIPRYNISGTGNPNTPRLASGLFPGGISSSDRAIADNLRYLLGGIVGSGTVQANFVDAATGPVIGAPRRERVLYNTQGLYFSDQWRIKPNLTLNLGLRWDFQSPLENPEQVYLEPDLEGARNRAEIRTALLDPTGQLTLLGNNAGKPGRFYKPDFNNFGPILGVAYSSPDGKGILGRLLGTGGVLRGGFRMSTINDGFVKASDNAGQANAGLDFSVGARQNGTASLNARFNNLPGFVLPAFQSAPISFAQANANDSNFTPTFFVTDPNVKTQQNMEYSIGIQRELGWNTALEIRYVGGRSNDLLRGFDFNQVNINSSGFLTDFLSLRNNCRVAVAANNAIAGNPTRFLDGGCSSGEMLGNGLAGQTPVSPAGSAASFIGAGIVRDFVRRGIVGELAQLLITNGLEGIGGSVFRANPNAGNVDLTTNSGRYRYNALQVELRRRFTNGFQFQGNYTFQKILADTPNDTQARFQAFLDINNQGLEYSRADYDRTHTVNINTNLELPFGKGKRFLNQGGLVDKIFGGFQFTSIINISSGVPISIKDINGTLNRTGRSNRQTAFSNLSSAEIKKLTGIFHQNGIVYFIDPSVIAPNGSAIGSNLEATPDSRFPGQVFFRAQPGQTGNLQRAFINGPWFYNWDAGLIKNIRFGERYRVQLRAEAFNVLNRTNYRIAENTATFDVDSQTFGQIPSANTRSPRIMQFALRFEF